jgi:hypothetical protein
MLYSTTTDNSTELLVVTYDDDDGAIAIEPLPLSPTTALLERLIDDEAVLAGCIAVAYAGIPGEGPPSSMADVATRLHRFIEFMWGSIVQADDPDYLDWGRPFGRHAQIDWDVVAAFIQSASTVFTPDEAWAVIAEMKRRYGHISTATQDLGDER